MTEPATPPINRRDIRRRRSLVAQTALKLLGKTGALIGLIWIGLTALLGIFAPFLANSRPITWLVQNEQGEWSRQFPLFAHLTPTDVMLAVGSLLAAGLACAYRAGGKLVWVWVIPMAVTVCTSLLFHLASDYDELLKLFNAEQASLLDLVQWWLLWLSVALVVLGAIVLGGLKLSHHPRWLAVAGVLAVVIGGALLSPTLRVEPRSNFAYDAYRAMVDNGEAKDALFAPVPYSPDDLQVDAPVTPTLLPPGPSPSEPAVAAQMVSYLENVFSIRLYALDQQDGNASVTPAPDTIEEAYAAADGLADAYRDKQQDDPLLRDIELVFTERAQASLDELAQTQVGQRYHLMGTTSNGEDLTSRMIHGSRIALVIGFIATGIAVAIGVVVGGLLGYFAGWVDLIGLRLVEIFASIPVIMLLIMIVAFYGRSLILMMVVLGLTGWVGYAYFVRAEFLKLRKMDYVVAARAAGTPLHLILFRHMLPNGVAPVLVAASFGIASAIMTEATLSFLGLGLEKEPSWGQMLNQARQGGSFSWWLAIYPGMAIFLTVFAYNLIGEALRDVIDPRAVK